MGLKISFILFSFFIQFGYCLTVSGQNLAKDEEKFRIDSINIQKNWRTKERIIKEELGINAGDSISVDQLRTSVSQIWNIGNFAKVHYDIDTLKDDRLVLNIYAQDAFTIVPIFSFTGNDEEYELTLGVRDNNFMGRNISLGVEGTMGTNTRSANLNVGIPRQLLYKNMTLNGSFLFGEEQKYSYLNQDKISGIAYTEKKVSFSVGNPNHTDYHYSLSPNLNLSYFTHSTDSTKLDPNVNVDGDYKVKYFHASSDESIGMINRIRHQQNGYLLTGQVGTGIGLNVKSPSYLSMGLDGIYSNLINPVVEFDASFSTAFTTSTLPSLINYLDPDHVKGILTGERSGQAIYSASASTNLTYINRDWFAIEQSFFVNIGNATNLYRKLYTTQPLFSAGSRIRVLIPMIPWFGVSFYYAYRGNGNHWYSLDF